MFSTSITGVPGVRPATSPSRMPLKTQASAVDYLRSAQMAQILRLDPARIVLIGHSMGGFLAVQAAAADPGIVGIGLISAADMGGRIPRPVTKDREQADGQRVKRRLRSRWDGAFEWVHAGAGWLAK